MLPPLPDTLDAAAAVAHSKFDLPGRLAPQAYAQERIEPPRRRPHSGPESWATVAMLFHRIWSDEWTFAHIAKTGGTSVEVFDLNAPHTTLESNFRLRKARDEGRSLDLSRRGCLWWPLAHRPQPILVHMPPADWRRCAPQHDPYRGRKVYCVMRKPTERFASEFTFAFKRWYWPKGHCPRPSRRVVRPRDVRPLLECFVGVAERLLASYNAQVAAAESQDGATHVTPVTRDGAPLAPQPHATVNYSELLTHLLPQSAYIVDRAGRPTCHSVFTIATLRAAGLPRENAQEELYNGSRPATRALLRRGTPLGERVRRLYAQDVQLWQRQLEGRPPTAAHSSVAEQQRAFDAAYPQLAAAEPSCHAPARGGCAACSVRDYNMTRTREGCIVCALSHRECGGFGPWPLTKLPHSTEGPLCGGVGQHCNTCDACCAARWVSPSGADCQRCHELECPAGIDPPPRGAVAMGGPLGKVRRWAAHHAEKPF